MAEPEHSCRRTIELEVELRLVKEQLSQAQQGTQYLVNCFGNGQGSYRASTADAGTHLREVEAENANLRRQLAAIEGRHNKWLLEQRPRHSCFQPRLPEAYQSCSLKTFPDPASHLSPGSDDLLSFDDTGLASFTTTNDSLLDSASRSHGQDSSLLENPDGSPCSPLTPMATYNKGGTGFHSKIIRAQHGLCISTISQQETGTADNDRSSGEPIDGSITQLHASEKPATDTARDGPEEPSFSGNLSTDDGGWHAPKTPSPHEPELVFSKPFNRAEHTNLVGMATFIEDMSDGEQESYWKLRGIQEPRHSADEWKQYYDAVVRPRYLAYSIRNLGTNKDVVDMSKQDEKEQKGEESQSTQVVSSQSQQGWIYAAQSSLRASAESFEPIQKNTDERSGSEGKHSLEDTVSAAESTVGQQGQQIEQTTDVEPLNLKFLSLQQDSESSKASTAGSRSCSAPVERLKSIRSSDLILQDLPPSPHVAKPALTSASTLVPTPPLTPARFPDPSSRHSWSSSGCSTTRGPRGTSFQPFPTDVDQLFFRYGAQSPSLCRTVLLSNIPTTVSLAEVLDVLRGGKIVSATYLQTARFKTIPSIAHNTIMVVFLHTGSAMGFVDYCNSQGIALSHEDKGQRSKLAASMIQTPSRPLSPRLMQEIRRGLTRILFIVDEQNQWTSEQIVRELVTQQPVLKHPLIAGKDESGVLFFQFADIKDSAEAWKIVDQDFAFFRGASKGFWPDPCERSWTTESKQGCVGMEDGVGTEDRAVMEEGVGTSEVEDDAGKV